MDETLELFREASRLGFQPSPDEPCWVWCEKNIVVDKTSPMPGRWRLANSPWVRGPMDCFQQSEISDISIRCAAQTAKTQTLMNLLCWIIACDPGSTMWVMAAMDEAKTFARTRLMPTLEGCPEIVKKFPENRHEKSTLEINFSEMPLIINGANSQSKLQSKPVRWLFLDEVRNYPPGALEMVLMRTRSYWNAKRVVISTPDMKDDAVDRAFLDGDQRHYHVECPQCKARAPLIWDNMKWDTNEDTNPEEGQWNFNALTETIRYEFACCHHAIRDTPDKRRELAGSGVWVPHNLSAPNHRASFTWNAILAPWVKWRDLVEEFIRAKEAVKVGAVEPLKTFINESLGEPWEERMEEEKVSIQKSDYKIGQDWDQEKQRFLTVDMQKDHFWAVCRAWSDQGGSRLVWEGKLLTFEDIHQKQLQYRVTERRVLIDSGYEATQVYEECLKYGWTALKGEDRKSFAHIRPNSKPVERVYSPTRKADPGIGTVAQGRRWAALILWSNPSVKDILDRLKKGRGAIWQLPSDISAEYLYQIDSETKRLRHNKLTGQAVHEWVRIGKRPNHLWDCECMQVVAAVMAGLLAKHDDS